MPVRRTLLWVGQAVIAGVLLSACGGVRSDRADSEPAAPEQPRDFDEVFQPLARFRLDADSTDPIGRVSQVIVWRGQYVVLDGMQANLKVFDPNGRLVRTIGRVGDGPGEFREPFRAVVMADGRLAVLDMPRVYVSVFDWPGEFSHGWTIAGIQPGGIVTVGDSVLVAVRLVGAELEPEPEGAPGAVQVYQPDGTILGSVMKVQPPSGPYRYTLAGQYFARVGRVLMLAQMDTNAVRFYDLHRHVEWKRAVAEATYEPPAYPSKRPSTVEALSRWARSQWWMTNIIGAGDIRFIAQFSTMSADGTEIHRYSIGAADGRDLVVTRDTPVNLVGASGDTLIGASESPAGGAEIMRFLLRPTFDR